MTITKIVASFISGVNIYYGFWFLLNALNILQESKYSKASTIVIALLLLFMGVFAIYLIALKNLPRMALWVGIGPWLIALVFLFIVMITSDYH